MDDDFVQVSKSKYVRKKQDDLSFVFNEGGADELNMSTYSQKGHQGFSFFIICLFIFALLVAGSGIFYWLTHANDNASSPIPKPKQNEE